MMTSAMMERAEFPGAVKQNVVASLHCVLFGLSRSTSDRNGPLRAAWLHGAQEGAEELAFDLRSEGVHVDSLPERNLRASSAR